MQKGRKQIFLTAVFKHLLVCFQSPRKYCAFSLQTPELRAAC